MKKTIYIIAMLFSLNAFSQKNNFVFEDGYIITNSNDTLIGQIKIMKDDDMYHKVYFKDTKNIIRIYGPTQLLEYYYFNDQYVSAFFENQPCFFKVLVKGKLKLFKMLVKKGNQEPEITLFASANNDEGIIKLEEERLNKQLKRLFKTNGKLQSYVNKRGFIPLQSDTLTSYFITFNNTK